MDDDAEQVSVVMAIGGSSAVRLTSFLKRASQVSYVTISETVKSCDNHVILILESCDMILESLGTGHGGPVGGECSAMCTPFQPIPDSILHLSHSNTLSPSTTRSVAPPASHSEAASYVACHLLVLV